MIVGLNTGDTIYRPALQT